VWLLCSIASLHWILSWRSLNRVKYLKILSRQAAHKVSEDSWCLSTHLWAPHTYFLSLNTLICLFFLSSLWLVEKKKKGFCLCVFGVGKHKSQLCLVLSAQLHFCPSPLHHSAISAFIIKAEPIRTNTEQFVATWDGFHWRRWEEYLSCGVDEIKTRIFLEEINNGYSVQSSTIEGIVTLSQATAGILISIYF